MIIIFENAVLEMESIIHNKYSKNVIKIIKDVLFINIKPSFIQIKYQ